MSRPVRVYLADLAHTHSVSASSIPVPLSIGFVAAYAKAEHGAAIDVRLFKDPTVFLAAIAETPPDVVGFANYGWNENLTRTVGRHLRRTAPNALIVAGGPNIDNEDARRLAYLTRHDYVDYLIVDGGEEPFSELLAWWRDGADDRDTRPRNLVWREGDRLRSTPVRPVTKRIDAIRSPYLNGDLDEFLDAGMVPLFETNRGCPFKCTFCAWGAASKDIVARRELDTVLQEIDYVGARSRARNWIVCDANFGILPRDVEIARAIRKVRDERGYLEKCHIWLAKNVTERNLEIGEILGDLTVPVMAVQSLDEKVLRLIKRDNISLETYAAYQQEFHRIGSRTYSDLIVPLPGETLDSHLNALGSLFELGVDIIQNHNMRLLAGAETNSSETRQRYAFTTRYRLIHGDAGAYPTPDGGELRAFEYEESLRSTDTMSEEELFYLRKLHFLVDFCWNLGVYKPLIEVAQAYGVPPLDIIAAVLSNAEQGIEADVARFFEQFEAASGDEWFGSPEAIEAHFFEEENFRRLINAEHDKLNILFSVRLLQGSKPRFDALLSRIVEETGKVPARVREIAENLSFARFPALSDAHDCRAVRVPENWAQLTPETAAGYRPAARERKLRFVESPRRREVARLIADASDQTLSKILNTQSYTLQDLAFVAADDQPA